MTYKPILFNTPMVRAVLDGRKTVTRRVIKPQPDTQLSSILGGAVDTNAIPCKCPCYPGDILWVRETWQYAYNIDDCTDQCVEGTGRYLYYADGDMPFSHWIDPNTGEHKERMPWRPSIHMPKEAARIFLRVTDVRVERLQDITDEQAKAEGVPDEWPMNPVYCPACKGEGLIGAFHPVSLGYMEIDCPHCKKATARFKNLWESTIQPSSLPLFGWDANPWVWVIEFERCEKPEGWFK